MAAPQGSRRLVLFATRDKCGRFIVKARGIYDGADLYILRRATEVVLILRGFVAFCLSAL